MADVPTDAPAPAEEPIVEIEAPEPTNPEEPEQPAEPEAPAPAPESEDEQPPVRTDWRAEYFKGKQRGTIAPPAQPAQPPAPAGDDLRSVIREELAPIAQSFAKSKDEEELQAALSKYPEAKKIEKTVRRYMENDAYARVPVEFIVRGLIGAREAAKNKADLEAKGTRQGGHSRRPTETKQKSAWDLSDADFDKAVKNLMSGQTPTI